MVWREKLHHRQLWWQGAQQRTAIPAMNQESFNPGYIQVNIKTAHSFHWLNVCNKDFVIVSSPGPSLWRFSKWRIVGRNPWQRLGAFPFTKKFRKSRSGCKCNTSFWVVPLGICRNKRNSWKGSPVFPLKSSQWKICVHLQIYCLYHQYHGFGGVLRGQASLEFPNLL